MEAFEGEQKSGAYDEAFFGRRRLRQVKLEFWKWDRTPVEGEQKSGAYDEAFFGKRRLRRAKLEFWKCDRTPGQGRKKRRQGRRKATILRTAENAVRRRTAVRRRISGPLERKQAVRRQMGRKNVVRRRMANPRYLWVLCLYLQRAERSLDQEQSGPGVWTRKGNRSGPGVWTRSPSRSDTRRFRSCGPRTVWKTD